MRLTNCRRKSSLLVINFRVRMVHDFSAILTEAPGSDAQDCESVREGDLSEAAACGIPSDSRYCITPARFSHAYI